MAQFSYKARRRSGELVQGNLEVPDRTAALAQIERMGLFPIAVDAGKAQGGAAARPERAKVAKPSARSSGGAMPAGLKEFLNRQRKPQLKELATFTRQLANLLRSGMPLTLALNSMAHLESKGIGGEVSRKLKQDVMEGKGLSEAMAKQPVVFSDLYVNMVRAGEQSGALEEVLQRLATHFERFAEVQQRFTSALIYPALVAVVGILIVIFFMTFMLPKFLMIFEGLDIELPWATQLLVGLSNFFSNPAYLLAMALGAIAVVVVFLRVRATERGRRMLDQWKLRAPVFGKVFKLNLHGQFARTLATLLENGVPVLTALKITEQTLPNHVLKEAVARTREEVTDGKTIAQPLARSRVFPQLMIDLVKIGEETGDVPGALHNVADTYEGELSTALRVLTNLIEPTIIIILAVGVGFLLFSVLSAMFSVTSSISR